MRPDMNADMQSAAGAGYRNDSCPVCEQQGQAFHHKDGYDIDRCTHCGFLYVRNIPSSDFLIKAYEPLLGTTQDYVPEQRQHKQLKNWWFAKRIRHVAGHRKRLLEVGYAAGNLLKALQRERVFELEGIDYSEGPYKHLKELGLTVSLSSIEDKKYPDEAFDMVVGLHVLEHVQNPMSFIREVHRVLSPQGRIYFQVPCPTYWRARLAGRNWRGFSPPFHLWYFSPRSIRLFLIRHGFRVLSAHRISHRAHLTVVAEKA
jgi:SAM-dependent methyltransferase